MVEVEVIRTRNGENAYVFGPGLRASSYASERAKEMIMSISSVVVPPLQNRDSYVFFPEEQIVDRIVGELDDGLGIVKYKVKFRSGHNEPVSFDSLINLENGKSALHRFQAGGGEESDDDDVDDVQESAEAPELNVRTVGRGRRLRQHSIKSSYINLADDDSDDEITVASAKLPRSTRARRRTRQSPREDQSNPTGSSESPDRRRSFRRRASARTTEPDYIGLLDEDKETPEEDINLLQSDILPHGRKRKRRSAKKSRHLQHEEVDGVKFNKPRPEATRQSGRSTRNRENMKEIEMDDIYRMDSDLTARPVPKVVGAREVFQSLRTGDPFRQRHCQQCDTCKRWDSGPSGQLVFCQGCSLSYHKNCIGHRQSRDHLVSKAGDDNFVLQCRRCVNVSHKRDPTGPDQSLCQVCRTAGPACAPFRERRTAIQEERDREENNGEDPTVNINPALINDPKNVLFRCLYCFRAFHYHHLRPRSDTMVVDGDEDEAAIQRFKEYTKDWKCIECAEQTVKVSGLVAWRPVDPEAYVAGTPVQSMCEDDKEYMVKWEGKSYFQCVWMHGAWVWGVTGASMRRAFAKWNNMNNLPTMNSEDAIPEDYLRIDIVLDIRYTSIVVTRVEEVDKARIREVAQALAKYKGLGYEDAVWEKPPEPSDGDRWSDFVSAYDNWVMGRYIHCPKAPALKLRLEKVRLTDFTTLEKKKQPDKLVGGELMQYQLDGVNWLYYRWYKMQNAILADEMGLGKTIQVIGFVAALIQEHNCFPFLLVVPNSTCPNWRREIMKWAPSLRVATYFGSSLARGMASQYEMFPEGSKELRCHIVVTSYEAASDDTCQRFFRSVPWQGLVVDEGQRLKSDKTILYGMLSVLKISFKLLLTGTPLQNNARELFNLLQFLDDSFDAPALELEYAELTKENLPQLHDLIRPFFLRRTKAQVLTFLPPLAQIILPVSMSTVQMQLYQSILSRNPDLIRVIFDPTRAIGKGERANLNNLLMQLRKCLCHPFVYSRDIEDRSAEGAVSHRNLVEASSKLQLLELLLPKLQEHGHRVLIFSQFLQMLDIIEDFLDGLGLGHQRLDGTMSSLQKQKRIDEFNAPESPLFAFILSTRAGGVGINLATADTVIILDPDFNPHQDIQALSRAHRIGQKNKVLVYQLMTRASAEERIVQVGRKKMALDHVLIERMDKNDDISVDMESILRYGAAEILEGRTQELRYDDASIDKLLDRSQIEDTKAGEDSTAESQFSFARVWANDTASLMDSLESDEDVEKAPDPQVWEKILSERARIAAEQAATRHQALGRGKRARNTVDYKTYLETKAQDEKDREKEKGSGSDTDFHADEKSDADDEVNEEDPGARDISDGEVGEIRRSGPEQRLSSTIEATHPRPTKTKRNLSQLQIKKFRRSTIVWPRFTDGRPFPADQGFTDGTQAKAGFCYACRIWHSIGYCPLKIAGPEFCNLCGLAHYGVSRSCPHIRSETQVREMLEALKQSPESKKLVELAKKYLKGVKGSLVQDKKRKAEQATDLQAALSERPGSQPHGTQTMQPTTGETIYRPVQNVIQSNFVQQALLAQQAQQALDRSQLPPTTIIGKMVTNGSANHRIPTRTESGQHNPTSRP